MQINTNFAGSLSWQNIGMTQKEASQESGVDESTLGRIRQGKEGFSAKSARRIADLAGEDAATLYVASQARSIKMRRDTGEITDAGILKAVGRVLSTFKAEFSGALIPDEHAKALQDLAVEASKGVTATNQMERLGRDGSGLKVQKRANKSAVPTARDGSGMARTKRYGS